MIISHELKCIFLKTRKTAGTSIDMALSKYCGSQDIIAHLNKDDEALKKQLRCRTAQNYFVPLRHWSFKDGIKLLLKGRRPRYNEHMSAESLRQRIDDEIWNGYFKFCIERNPYDKAISLYYWRTRAAGERHDFVQFLKTVDRLSLSNKHIYTIDDRVAVDQVILYEKLEEGLESVSKRLGIDRLELPRAKTGHRVREGTDRDLLTPEARRIIEDACGWEIETFGYSALHPLRTSKNTGANG